MEQVTYVILDDEPIAHRIIEGYCENFSFLAKAGNFYNGFEALEYFRSNQVDLIFLDINMPKLTGFELLKSLPNPPKVIVTSAHQEFALQGYELDIADYLLKPFSLDRFIKAINKVCSSNAPASKKEDEPERIFLKSDKKHIQLELQDILYVEALGNYCKVFHQSGMLICPEKISELEEKLAKGKFLRVHKSYLVNTAKIQTIEGNRIKIDRNEIPIGQTYRAELNKLLG
ncbi:LytR/AlgR family response regulator transcription factor [Algoriphagus machipongonensis]|uniref:Response regulator receiver domain protein n=1 Tax=Algoriphagus machipongonensis TaxID=388413 RepID=A3HWC7_9BACT|nr:LytTR family DNA-binding domain-containing protein [Algoriphagus machipongonensis]EAZ80900.1 response regulator receiver domain protein [Algoriphagus machipongonensis]